MPQPGEDGWKENNRAIADLLLKGEGAFWSWPVRMEIRRHGLAAALKASRQRGGNDRQPRPAHDSSLRRPRDSIALVNVPAESLGVMQQRAPCATPSTGRAPAW
ncbi:MAG: hypothetical protein U1F87_06925 [Kiritimatiellia bacterium]